MVEVVVELTTATPQEPLVPVEVAGATAGPESQAHLDKATLAVAVQTLVVAVAVEPVERAETPIMAVVVWDHNG
jgi:hypothetical protein